VNNCIWEATLPDSGLGRKVAANNCFVLGDRTRAVTFVAPGDALSVYQAHEYTRQWGLPVGFGTDMNGFTFQPGPRLVGVERSAWLPRNRVRMNERVLGVEDTYTGERGMGLTCLEWDEGQLVPARQCASTSRYGRSGLATVGQSPQLAADLACVAGRHSDIVDAACAAAYGRVKRVNVCTLGIGGGPLADLCDGPRGFVARWAGLETRSTPPALSGPVASSSIEETPGQQLEPSGADTGEPGWDAVTREALPAGARDELTGSPRSIAAIVELATHPTAFSVDSMSLALTFSKGQPAAGINVATPGEQTLAPRELARIYVRELRRRGPLGAACRTADAILEEQRDKKRRKVQGGR